MFTQTRFTKDLFPLIITTTKCKYWLIIKKIIQDLLYSVSLGRVWVKKQHQARRSKYFEINNFILKWVGIKISHTINISFFYLHLFRIITIYESDGQSH